MVKPASSDETVKYRTPGILATGICASAFCAVIAFVQMTSPPPNAEPGPSVANLIFGPLLILGCLFWAAWTVRGFAISVTPTSVMAHGFRNRVMLYSQIDSVEIVNKLIGGFQWRDCLSFRLSDGSEYVYKRFNSGPPFVKKGHDQLVAVKDTIEARMVAAHGTGTVVPAPPPSPGRMPPPAPDSGAGRWNDGLGGPLR